MTIPGGGSSGLDNGTDAGEMFVSSAFKSGFSTMLLHLQQVCEQDE
jgi:hypothetical protein